MISARAAQYRNSLLTYSFGILMYISAVILLCEMQVLMKATRIRGCVQALVERSGFLPWLASAAVSYMDLSISEQDGKEASDLPIMVLEV
jgi:hypothetical protein